MESDLFFPITVSQQDFSAKAIANILVGTSVLAQW